MARVYTDRPSASEQIAAALVEATLLALPQKRPLVVVCVGSDRSTGDTLGPMVGTLLQDRGFPYTLYGTLQEPVHAQNLAETKEIIYRNYTQPFVLVIDAALGESEAVGVAVVESGPLLSGVGVGKILPAIGHANLRGVVNVGGFMEHFVLGNTRLGFVWSMAHVIADAVRQWAAHMSAESMNKSTASSADTAEEVPA